MNHVTIGVYPSGDYKVNIVKPEHLQNHILYNKTFRPGRMLFVDGKYVVGGQFIKEQKEQLINEWEERIPKMEIDNTIPSDTYI